MAADFSRVRNNPLLDYAAVELKQGGVLLDADANELAAILDRRLRALAGDVLGRATVGANTPDAFRITLGRRRSPHRPRPALRRRPAGGEPRRCQSGAARVRRSDGGDALHRRYAVHRAAVPAESAAAAAGRAPSRLSRRVGSRGHAPRASRTSSRSRWASRRARACRRSGRCASSPKRRATTRPAGRPTPACPAGSM